MSDAIRPRPNTVVRDHRRGGNEDQALLVGNPRTEFRVAAFGDSLMWGQGLARDRRFSSLVSARLAAAAQPALTPVIAWDYTRSGAKINADPRERAAFVDTFPELFTGASGRAHRASFLNGDEATAHDLHGELPATFPTVGWQAEHIPAALGPTIKVALVSGGGNDLGLDTLLDPEEFEGNFVRVWDGLVRRIAHDDVLTLLQKVRTACPNAVIIYFGYFAPFTPAANMGKMKQLAKYMNANDITWQLNRVFGIKDIASILQELQARSAWLLGRAAYWQKMAVNDANLDPALRGPGIVFSPAGQTPDNCVFGANSLLWEGYADPAPDDARAGRVNACPRRRAAPQLRQLVDQGGSGQPLNVATLNTIRSALSGPTSLVQQLTTLITLLSSPQDHHATQAIQVAHRAVKDLAAADLARIQRSLIASFLHPNTNGARRYADIAVQRHTEHVALAAQIVIDARGGQRPPLANFETLSDTLTRCGQRRPAPLAADIGYLDVDSLSLWAVTARDSDRLLVPNIFLDVDTRDDNGTVGHRRYQLNMMVRIVYTAALGGQPPWVTVKKFWPEFEPATNDQFSVEVGAPLRLTHITRVSITMGKDDLAGKLYQGQHGRIWRPRRIVLEVNGRSVHDQVFRTKALGPGDTLRLPYPPPPPRGPVQQGPTQRAPIGARH